MGNTKRFFVVRQLTVWDPASRVCDTPSLQDGYVYTVITFSIKKNFGMDLAHKAKLLISN
jgi:hypothetical protein